MPLMTRLPDTRPNPPIMPTIKMHRNDIKVSSRVTTTPSSKKTKILRKGSGTATTRKTTRTTAAIIGFTFAYGAYMTEVFRAGIQSIPKGQMEAARSLGMNYLAAMRYVILPQAVRVILPPVGNEFVTLLKDSSLVSILAVSDLTRRGREFVARTFLSFDTFTMVALIYLILTLFFTRISTAVERNLSVEKR
jgi:ABC-type amino acid transport system permease subunit